MLNSSRVKEYVECHNISIQVGNIFKHMHLPDFKKTSLDHIALADLVEKAHVEANESMRAIIVQQVIQLSDKILDKWIKSEQRKIHK